MVTECERAGGLLGAVRRCGGTESCEEWEGRGERGIENNDYLLGPTGSGPRQETHTQHSGATYSSL